MEFPDLGPVSPRPSKTLKGVPLRGDLAAFFGTSWPTDLIQAAYLGSYRCTSGKCLENEKSKEVAQDNTSLTKALRQRGPQAKEF